MHKRIEVHPALLDHPTVDITQHNAESTQPQVCRTCVNTSNRMWQTSVEERFEAFSSGVSKEELMCQPDRVALSLKVLEKSDWRDRIVPLSYNSQHRTSAFLDTCGHAIAPKCRGCERFVPVNVRVPYSASGADIHWRVERKEGDEVKVPYTDDDSQIRYWNVAVGGHCSIPAEGMTIAGETVYCSPMPRTKALDNPSCANCKWLYYTGDQWISDHLEINRNAALTPWEREEAIRRADMDTNAGQAIGLALWRKQTELYGLSHWFRASVLKVGYHEGQLKFRLRFTDNLIVAVIAAGDPRYMIHYDPTMLEDMEESMEFTTDAPVVAVEVMYPHNKTLKLAIPLKSYRLAWPALPENIFVEYNKAKYAKETCIASSAPDTCTLSKPCYFHSKKPVRNKITGETTFENPKGNISFWKRPPHAEMKLVQRDGKWIAVDGNDNLPETYGTDVANATVFRHRMPSLMNHAVRIGTDAVDSLTKQYFEVTSHLAYDGRRKLRPGWLAPSTVEPGKPHCSHPSGLNLRKVFGDSFGLERVEFDFDMGSANTMRVEEEIRVGYRQHEHTPQRLQEEVLSTIRSHPRYDARTDTIPTIEHTEPESWSVTHIATIGDMIIDGRGISDTSEFTDMLDSEVQIGMHGEAPRVMSRRQQLYGYQMSRGFFGKRSGADKTTMPASENELAIFDWEEEPEEADINDAWACAECGAMYSSSEISFSEPICDCGADLLRINRTQPTANPRAGGGVGSAIIMDSERTMERQRLYSTLCPSWELRGNGKPVRLADVAGRNIIPEPDTIFESENFTSAIKIIKVAVLTEEHIKCNLAYKDKMDETTAKRDTYMNEHPTATSNEVLRLFPTPEGTIYQEKIAGSLAKMGSV